MATSHDGKTTTQIGRRGLIAAAAALAVGAAMKETAQPVGATVTNTDFAANGGTVATPLNYGFDAGSAGTFYTGVYGNGTFYGVVGNSASGYGVYGNTDAAPGSGKAGVLGIGNGAGTYGVYGNGYTGTGTGVYGTSPSGTGVQGSSLSGTGVQGNSASGIGVVGTTTSAGSGKAGIFGSTNVSGGTGLAGQIFGTTTNAAAFVGSAPTNNFAAYFTGAVVVASFGSIVGSLTVNGSSVVTGSKSAAIKHTDGTHRLVYCEEAPDSWLTDYGQAKLVGGKADVKIDADFAGIVKTDSYLTFLSPEGDMKGLYVTNKTATGFTVREAQGGTSSLVFNWRIAVKRSDIAAARLAKFEMPKERPPLTEPPAGMFDAPKPPAPPKPPAQP